MLTATVALMTVFALAYLVARRIDNYGIVDFVWAYCFTGVAWFYALSGSGWSSRALVIAALASIWSIRLGSHLYRRVMGHHPQEDSRYGQLREDWQANFGPMMFGFFQLQAVSIVILSAPFLFPTRNAFPGFNLWEIIGTAVCFLALVGETVADGQLAAFRRNPNNEGQVCDVGLWRYSRHPNYFFEWCIWVGFCLFACGSAWGWLSVIAPAAILHLLLNVTGVPMAEASSLKSKGDAFRAYQRTTNAFFPGPPRRPTP
ncbi:photosystem I reaction center subunit XII [Synoicihabitans lomoniglobus]|uniref:Photosystem I reaction center subunit XII n=1 Tax=Synoicihabitans lomoniglobus TaxID=2909285 RepID=A0AAE9ZWT4_9BACT|nr:photosystem I reaction center subunit XII [Opitutaceae bacterium LMO-M01]